MAFDPAQWTRLDCDELGIYVQPDKPDWFVPNKAGDLLLQNLMGHGSMPDGWRTERFLDRLPDACPTPYRSRADHLSADRLGELWFHITNCCNLSCTHCLFGSDPGQRDALSKRQILDIAQQAADLGCRLFALTGGEPFIHPDFERIVDGLLGRPETRVVILTNGTLIEKHGEALNRWPRERFHLQISVDGTPQNHDRIRGEGTFERLERQLGFLAEAHIPVTVAMSVNADNVDDMPDVVDFAAQSGSNNVHFMWHFVRGRASDTQPPLIGRLFDSLTRAVGRAEENRISIDNIDSMKSQVFAPAGTRHDGSGSGWDSAAIGPDGRLYPSAATVGLDALATSLDDGLAAAWKNTPVLNALRQVTAATLTSPLRFLTGGGDPDHSHVHSGEFIGSDPYVPLYEQLALSLIAQEAKQEPDDGPPGLRLKMGDVLESCGGHGGVAMTHHNCLLAVAGVNGRTAVKEFYTRAAQTANTDILNPASYPEEFMTHIPPASRLRSYGCGSPVLDADLEPGNTVVDLGCGTGVECFVAARFVGSDGQVIGVDMLDPMLELARQGARGVTDHLGYENLDFRKGYLEELPVESNSVDVVLSNCVINLSPHKRCTFREIRRILRPGGRLVIADVVCETEPDPSIRNDDRLRGECLGGALTQKDLTGLLEETGFVSFRAIKRFPYRTVHGHAFHSMTFEARKPAPSEIVRVMYRGPFQSVRTHTGMTLPAGETRPVRRDEIAGLENEVFVFDDEGRVSNLDIGDDSGCGCTSFIAKETESAGCCDTTVPLGLGNLCADDPTKRADTEATRAHESLDDESD